MKMKKMKTILLQLMLREYDFILKHDNMAGDLLNDYIIIHNELGYE